MIRPYDPDRDAEALRRCTVALQEDLRALEPDLPAGEAMADAYRATLFDRIARFGGEIRMAEQGGRVVGFAAVLFAVGPEEPDRIQSPAAWVTDLVVVPGHRGRGLGKALLGEVEAAARRAGARTLNIGVLSRNADAARLYRAAGFRDYHVEMTKRLE
ncbi:MAG: GNAT family N-acetyltransferase [Myxococcota bacterium]